MYNDSTRDRHKLRHSPLNCVNKSLSDWLSAPEISASFSSFLVHFWLYLDQPVTIEWLSPARSPRACDLCATHTLR